ncbi:MAG: flippase [Gemmatimonadaceae bacterium]
MNARLTAASAQHSDRILRHTSINLAGAVLPLIVAFFAVPRVIVGLGLERFGVLMLSVAIVGSFGVFDFGLGRATTKFMALALADAEESRAAEYFWTALGVNVVLGLIGGVLFLAAAPFLAARVLKVPPDLVREVTWALRAMAILVPLKIINSALIGALEAQRRFALANTMQVPAQALVQLVPLVCLAFTRNVAVMVLGIAGVRVVLVAVTFVACLSTFPALRERPGIYRERLGDLLHFGGWLTVSNIIAPLVESADRLLIGSILSLQLVAYYATPYDMIIRLTVIPGAVSRALFPLFGSGRVGDGKRFASLLLRITRLLALSLSAVIIPIVVLNRELLTVWISAAFAQHARVVLVILPVGVLMTSLAYTPYALVQGVGRPDITAKLHLLELMVYAPLLLVLLIRMGIEGAALAWVSRVTLDAGLLMWAARNLTDPSHTAVQWSQLRRLGLVLLPMLAMAVAAGLAQLTPWTHVGIAVLLELCLAALALRFLIDPADLAWIRATLQQRRAPQESAA